MILSLLKQKYVFGVNILICVNFLLVFYSFISAQKLPFKSFTTTDGLPNNQSRKTFQDKKGFIWFATNEGLSRFDGYGFTNYDDRDGLGDKRINDIQEDSNGRFWVANNNNGVSLKINQSPNLKFKTFSVGKTKASNSVNRILIDSNDFLWCLTDDGLFRAELSDDPKFELIHAYKSPIAYKSRLLFQGNDGHLWFAVERELFEVIDGRIIPYGGIPFKPDLGIYDGFQDKKGRFLFVANENGPFEFVRPKNDQQNPEWHKLLTDLQNTTNFRFIMQDDRDRIWFAGWGGFFRFTDETLQKVEFHEFGGLDAISMMQDREGNFWIGTWNGPRRISNESIMNFTAIEDVELPEIKWIKEEENGNFKLGFIDVRQQYINKFRKAKISGSRIKIGDFDALISSQNGNYSVLWQSEWKWKDGVDFPVSSPVFQLRSGKKIDAEKYLEKPLENESFVSFYEDEKGSLWFVKNDEFLHRADPNVFPIIKTEKFPCGLSQKDGNSTMMTDFNGGVWIFASVIKRFRNNRCENVEDESLNKAQATKGFPDSRGWLWIATNNGGVGVTKNQSDDKPAFRFYTENDGLINRTVWSITEDNFGRMYFGTSQGLSRFDPQNGQWKSFTSKDGLPNNEVHKFYNDSAGNIWILAKQGFAKLNPNLERKSNQPPPIYISHIKIAGEEYPISETGITENPLVFLDSSQNNLTIDFVGLQFSSENALNYQYKLEETNADWSQPDKNRSITFANLSSGEYRFVVRAINEDGLVSDIPASFQFRIYPPIYLRWWFVALSLLLISAIIYAFYRVRLQKLLEVERTRTLIATDLHDDIGSNLSKISVLSEVAKMQIDGTGNADHKLLTSIANISRESLNSMKDIVWAINPQRDSALEMTRKMREQAEEIFVPKDVKVVFSEMERREKLRLPMNLRRDLFLIYKEAINNIAKHSNCLIVKIKFKIYSKEIYLQIEDDGIGFDLNEETNGNGLLNMQKRAQRLNGVLQIESTPNQGTKIIVSIPQ